jgi:chorismate dehydratase
MALLLGAVGYLNARPLTWALDRSPKRWRVRYDVPAVCASLLAAGRVDLGLVPSIEFLQSEDYRLVPGVGIGSYGPVFTVALYSRVPLEEIRQVALDLSSRTSVALIRILCERHFHIDPTFVPRPPDLRAMTAVCDAALLIGDPAFEVDHHSLGLTKIDLGAEWTAFTGLPFVYAAWTGPRRRVSPADVEGLQQAQADGLAAVDAIATEYGGADEAKVARAKAYLIGNMRYGLGEAEAEGLQRFLNYAFELGLAPRRRSLEFF